MSEEIVNVQVKVPKKKHAFAKKKMVDEDNMKSFQKLFMKALDRFISTSDGEKKNKGKKKQKKLRRK